MWNRQYLSRFRYAQAFVWNHWFSDIRRDFLCRFMMASCAPFLVLSEQICFWHYRLSYQENPQMHGDVVTFELSPHYWPLTHWGRATHICVSKLTIIGSNNGLAPVRRQAIILTSAYILLIGPLGINFSEILIEIHAFSFRKIHLKMSSGKWRPFCLGLNVLTYWRRDKMVDISQMTF